VRERAVTIGKAFGKDARRFVGAGHSRTLAANKQGHACREGADTAKDSGRSSLLRPIFFSRRQGL